MQQSATSMNADTTIQKLRDSMPEDDVLDLAITMMGEMADFLCDIRQIALS